MTSHLSKIQKLAQSFLHKRPLFGKIQVVEATPQKVICTFHVERDHLNINNTLFGGYTASLIDIGGSLAIASKSLNEYLGVSTDMSIQFMSAAKEGDIVRIESKCLKSGRNLAFTFTELYVDDKIIASGSHTKYMKK